MREINKDDRARATISVNPIAIISKVLDPVVDEFSV